MPIGNKIYELRKNANLNQEQLAEKINVTRQTISNWETDQTVPDIYQSKELAIALNVSLDYLVDNEVNDDKSVEDNYKEIWNKSKEKLREKISLSLIYDTWIKDLKFVNYKDGILTLSTLSEIYIIHLKNNYIDLIKQAFHEVSNIEIKEINFILNSEE